MNNRHYELNLSDLIERFDHVAVAVRSIADSARLIAIMGGQLTNAGVSANGAFQWAQYALAGGTKLELIQPLDGAGADHFLVRFLATRGEGLHHVTLKVTDLEEAIQRCEEMQLTITGVDLSKNGWKEAFVHPKTANGVLVQLAEWVDTQDQSSDLQKARKDGIDPYA